MNVYQVELGSGSDDEVVKYVVASSFGAVEVLMKPDADIVSIHCVGPVYVEQVSK